MKDKKYYLAIFKTKDLKYKRQYLVFMKGKRFDEKKGFILNTSVYSLNLIKGELNYDDENNCEVEFNDIFKRFAVFCLSNKEREKFRLKLIEREI